jgi:hypothetical protein
MVSAHTRPVILLAAMAAQLAVSPARRAEVNTLAFHDSAEALVNTRPEPASRRRAS